jgi:sulfite exporter TauE/SafE
VRIERLGLSRIWPRFISKLMMSSTAQSKFGLGLLMGLLPCGLLYAALINAVSTGDALSGALAMASFATGTSLALLGIGLFSTAIGARLGRWATTFATVSVMLMGAFLVWRGITPTPGPGVNCHGSS